MVNIKNNTFAKMLGIMGIFGASLVLNGNNTLQAQQNIKIQLDDGYQVYNHDGLKVEEVTSEPFRFNNISFIDREKFPFLMSYDTQMDLPRSKQPAAQQMINDANIPLDTVGPNLFEKFFGYSGDINHSDAQKIIEEFQAIPLEEGELYKIIKKTTFDYGAKQRLVGGKIFLDYNRDSIWDKESSFNYVFDEQGKLKEENYLTVIKNGQSDFRKWSYTRDSLGFVSNVERFSELQKPDTVFSSIEHFELNYDSINNTLVKTCKEDFGSDGVIDDIIQTEFVGVNFKRTKGTFKMMKVDSDADGVWDETHDYRYVDIVQGPHLKQLEEEYVY